MKKLKKFRNFIKIERVCFIILSLVDLQDGVHDVAEMRLFCCDFVEHFLEVFVVFDKLLGFPIEL